MNTLENGRSLSTDDSIEKLLGKATPRPVPSVEEAEVVRQNVYAEWQKLTRRRQRQRRFVSLAVAASVLVAVFATFNTFRIDGIAEMQVASIGKSFGSIYVLGENAELLQGNNLSAVTAGQTLITGDESGMGLAWEGGGSLRIDEDTRIEFVSRDSIYLRSGRVYFDSSPEMLADAGFSVEAARLTIVTDHGTVTHVGTQYMTHADAGTLTISVREGKVLLEGRSAPNSASGGQQLQIRDGRNASKVNIKSYGDNWHWIEQMSPAAVVDGRSVHEFLRWVSHETGLSLQYADDGIEQYAKAELLKGIVETDPTSALRIWMMAVDLDYRITEGVIRVGRFSD